MPSITRTLGALLAGVLSVAACDTAPTAAPIAAARPNVASASAHEVEESLISLDGVHFSFACSVDGEPIDPEQGELVAMQGQIYEKFTTRRDAMGGYHVTLQVMPVGLSGVGVTSGETFRAIEREQAAYNQTQAGFNGAWRSELKLTGTETGRVLWLVSTGTYRLSAEGDLVVEREALTTRCRPARG